MIKNTDKFMKEVHDKTAQKIYEITERNRAYSNKVLDKRQNLIMESVNL